MYGCYIALTGRPPLSATSYMVGREDKRTKNRTMLLTLKNNTTAGYEGPVKKELFKGEGLLDQTKDITFSFRISLSLRQYMYKNSRN